MFTSLATAKLSDLLRPHYVGNPVNSHVVESVKERTPDFDAMKRAIETAPQPEAERETSTREPKSVRAE
jgi:hypothetical protein